MAVLGTDFAAFPVRDPIAIEDPTSKALLIPRPWIDWFTALTTRVGDTPNTLDAVTLTSQNAAIGITPIPLENFGVGLYRVTYYARVTQAATTSSSLTVSIGWVDGGVGCTYTAVPMTNNTTATVQSNSIMLRSDEPPVISYATAYASVGATPMLYSLDVIVEVIAAA